MRTFKQNPNAGMVGPMFMGKGDLISEAGGLIFSDGSAWHFATGKEPYFEMYYMRRADYISAACVVLLRETYKRAGGFDTQVHSRGGQTALEVSQYQGSTHSTTYIQPCQLLTLIL